MNAVDTLKALKANHSSRGSVVEIAYWTLREAIREGRMQAGERLMEVPIAEALDMSRTPVREALRRLETEQLIKNVPRRGLIVPEMTLEDLMEIFSIREYLEGLAARLATDHMSRVEVDALEQIVIQTEAAMHAGDLVLLAKTSSAFHQQILQGARNSRLPKLVSLLYDAHRSTGLHQLQDERQERAVMEHQRIFEAIRIGDGMQAEQIMRAHIHAAFQHQVRMLPVG